MVGEPHPRIIALARTGALLTEVSTACAKRFTLLKTGDPTRAIAWMEAYPDTTALAVEDGLPEAMEALRQASERRPDVRRILLTEYNDLGAVIAGLHSGVVQHVVQRPVHPMELLAAAKAGELCCR